MKQHRTSLTLLFVILILLSLYLPLRAQYWGETVLEKSFERADFFFRPAYINPFGLGSFSGVSAGLLEDPLLSLSINPALYYTDSSRRTYLYLDFRNSKTIEDDTYYISPFYGYNARVYDSYYYPFFYVRTRQELEPVICCALLSNPLEKLSFGLTYQSVFQDEKYYAIPQDIYRSNIGYDYAGNSMIEDSSIPITDKYSGSDNMHQMGHFMSLFGGYEIFKNIRLGMKIARAYFDRDGSFGSNNFWESSWRHDNTSVYFNQEARQQDYDHWDFTAGVQWAISESISFGVKGGYLWGDVAQTKTLRDSSLYSYGEIDVFPEWSYYWKRGDTEQHWDHSGDTYYGGVNGSLSLGSSKTLLFYYTFQRQEIDLYNRTSVQDSSYGNYRSEWSNNHYYSDSDYALRDIRSGSGENITDYHRVMLGLRWSLDASKILHLGCNVGIKDRTIGTIERIDAARHNRSYYISSYYPEGEEYYSATVEKKQLYWDFDAHLLEIQIPIVFTWRLSQYFEVLFGLNRRMSSWRIDEVTLAIFDLRKQTYDNVTTTRHNFGERYTQPQEKMSDINTALLGGVTISPSNRFDIRLLVVPNFTTTYAGDTFKEFQWWIGLNVYP